jgi:23S rRNA (adenine2503-C2)-methyltransferase
MPSLADFDLRTFERELQRLGHKPSHGRRILRAFYDGCGEMDLDALPISRALREQLRESYRLRRGQISARHVSGDGTTKLLLVLETGGSVEAVLMPSWRDGIAAGCVSSQIGCAMGCDFCASTKNGLERNLDAGEIVEQFLHLRRLARFSGRRLKTLVFMGMGEPMHNLDNVIPAIERIAHPDLGGLGWRQIAVSTVGVVPGIDRLADADLGVHLALSLHAPDDATRATIIPANRRYPVADIMAAARRYSARSGRVVNIEYCLLGGVNDSNEHARLLAELMMGFRAHVNVIPYNPIGSSGVSGKIYLRPDTARVQQFVSLLRQLGMVCHIRATRGDDVAAACGQLRRRDAMPQLVQVGE